MSLWVSWLLLGIGIVLEVMGTTCMKLSDGFTRTVPSILMFVFWGLGFGFLSIALKRIDISIAYAIWSGAGIAIMAIVGIWWFNEDVSPLKVVSIVMVVAGVVGLNLAGGHAPAEDGHSQQPAPAPAGTSSAVGELAAEHAPGPRPDG